MSRELKYLLFSLTLITVTFFLLLVAAFTSSLPLAALACLLLGPAWALWAYVWAR